MKKTMKKAKQQKKLFFNRLVLSILISFFGLSTVSAQVKSISGVVKDPTGETIIGASVIVKGTTAAVITDVNGSYRINVPANGKVLVVTYIGMERQEVPITGSVINITLRNNDKSLEEVVVVGYGTVKRKDITGSVATVKSDALAAIPVSSVAEAITGKLAGVQVTTTEGSPDAEVKIRVRGGGSITGDNKPLYIVDGFPVESINDIASSDIEDISVLKDASSTAIYGSRGANGVILVTTKKGKAGKVSVNYNAFVSFKKMAKKLDVLSVSDYTKWQYELALLKNDGSASSYEKLFGSYADHDLYDNVPSNNWQDIVFGRTGFTFNHSLSISGGTETSKFAFNYNHIDDKAIMLMSNFKRDNLSLKLNYNPTKNLTLDFSTRYSGTSVNGGGMNEQNEKSTSDSRLKYAMIYTPIPGKNVTSDAGSSDDTPDSKLVNPTIAIPDNDDQVKRTTFNMAGSATWEIFKNFKVKTEFGYDDYSNNDSRFYGKTTYYSQNLSTIGTTSVAGLPAIILTNSAKTTFRNTNTINYDFKNLLNKDHSLNLMVGQEYITIQSNTLTNTVQGFPSFFTSNNAFKLSSQGIPFSTDNYFSPDDKLLSFFGRANYDYLGKYLLTTTIRTDGSSKFSEGNKWGYFPSAALAWRLSSESFMENTKKWLDDLKLRFSYGTAGNNNIPSGQMAQSYGSSSTSWIDGYTSIWVPAKIMANPDLKWETTVTRNIGLDYSLFNSKLSGSVEVYLNTTSDLLINFPTTGSGYDSQYRNMGETQNKGLEFSLNWVAIDKKNYGLSFSGNIGFNRNVIKSLGIMSDFSYASGWASTQVNEDYLIAKGGSVGQMYGYLSDGRYEVSDFDHYDTAAKKWVLKKGVADDSQVIGVVRPGSMKLKNITQGDSLVTTADRTVIGDANPLNTGGFIINARVYGFDFSANFNWSYGNKIYNANKIEYTSSSTYQYRNMTADMADGIRWTNLKADGTISNNMDELAKMNATTTMWSPYMNKYVFSDWAVEDGSYLRLSTVTLGYTLPHNLSKRLKIEKLRFYATGYNVFCLTKYSGFDPEVSTRRQTNLTPGVDYAAYPKSRQITIGLNLNF